MIDTAATRHLISVRDLTGDQLRWLVRRATAYAAGAPVPKPLTGRIVALHFLRSSTRTRTAFSAAALRLGAQIISYGPDDLQLITGETHADTGRVLSGMVDALVTRTAGDPAELRELAAHGQMPVINAMSADEHPTQAVADLTTIVEHFGRIEDIRLLYVGEGNNTAAALALALTRFAGAQLHLRTPAGYGLEPETLRQATLQAQHHGSVIDERHDLAELPEAIDAVYTTRWQTTGTSKPDPHWRTAFEPFRVDPAMMAGCRGAMFMHDLPAHRGEEVTADVLDGPSSIAFAQARNKYHSALAILEWCLGAHEPCDPSPDDGSVS
jgi:ornithine carbamoyltransferase